MKTSGTCGDFKRVANPQSGSRLRAERLDPGNETNLWNSKSLAKTARRIEASGAYLDSRRYPTMNLLYDILFLRPESLSLSRSYASFVIVAPLASRRVPTTIQLYRQNYGIRLEDPASRPEGALLRGHVLSMEIPARSKTGQNPYDDQTLQNSWSYVNT